MKSKLFSDLLSPSGKQKPLSYHLTNFTVTLIVLDPNTNDQERVRILIFCYSGNHKEKSYHVLSIMVYNILTPSVSTVVMEFAFSREVR